MKKIQALPQQLRQARGLLARPLTELQAHIDQAPSDSLRDVVACLADASSHLYQAEVLLNEHTDEHGLLGHFRRATEKLGQALSGIEQEAQDRPSLDPTSEAIAATLGLLYPVTQTLVRQRRAVMVGGPAELAKPLAYLPRSPEASDRPPPDTFAGSDRRIGEPRVFLEVDIGLVSDSHFYTGLSLDVSTGGVFVATYQPLEPGTPVRLYFVLGGESIEVLGIVRWTRDANGDTPPGMGVAFETLSGTAREAVEHFCASRTPLYHDSSD